MPDRKIPTGSFPYPLSDGPEESPYLSWVRNHSNYLTPRGFLDYLRAAAVLLRGIVVNLLTLTPFLIVATIALSLWSRPGRTGEPGEVGFVLTHWIALGVLAYFLVFPIVLRLFRVRQHSQSIAQGTDSSVKMRDFYERTFGFALLVVGLVVALEAFPRLLGVFHSLREADIGREVIAGSAASTSVIVLSMAGKILSRLGGMPKVVMTWLIGLLGILLPLLVVLYLSELLVYDNVTWLSSPPWWVLWIVLGLLGGGGLLALVYSLRQRGTGRAAFLFIPLALIGLAGAGLWYLSEVYAGPLHAPWLFLGLAAVVLWLYSWLTVDINLTSVSGFYRDRLASAYLVGKNDDDVVDIEHDIDLADICQYQSGSTAPYHIVNTALNLQGSKNVSIRDRNSDFFMFSKLFAGGRLTGYARTDDLEAVFPQMDLATAMAISAAAASPNMGRGTSPPLVAIMTLLNVRLGYWLPNPRRLTPWAYARTRDQADGIQRTEEITFEHVFEHELPEIAARWDNAYPSAGHRKERALADTTQPTTKHGFVGLAFSGGGIRSATVNLGIVQALERDGVFDHVDYMSTVSGGGYLGSSLSTLMRAEEYGKPSTPSRPLSTVGNRFRWRVRPAALWREFSSRLDEVSDWVNLSDGGHIENLATIELLRRRCKYVIIGDAEADPTMRFPGLATLIRFARIDLGIHIDINVDRVGLEPGEVRTSRQHFAVGTIHYPDESEPGTLLYFKSSVTGDEDEVIKEYLARNPTFPHQTTADQFFDEGQFEAYRSLGQHMATQALAFAPPQLDRYSQLTDWFDALKTQAPARKRA